MDKQALQYAAALIMSGHSATDVLEQTDGFAVTLPENTQVANLERFMPRRMRFRGTMTTSQITEFASYTNTMAGEAVAAEGSDITTVPCFVDPENMTAKVFFDLGTVSQPGHADHSAAISLPKTSALEELLSKNGQPLEQKELAEWMEDWAHQLKAVSETGEALSLPAAVGAVRRITIGAKSESTSEERTFGGRRSSMAEVEAHNKDTLPAFIDFTCEPYHGLSERTFRLRVSLITSEKPRLVMRIVRLEQQQEEMAAEFTERLIHELDGNLVETYVGNFRP